MITGKDTIFWAHEGPKLSWTDGVFHIEDLNPQMSVKWTMTADELRHLGERAIKLANAAQQVSQIN